MKSPEAAGKEKIVENKVLFVKTSLTLCLVPFQMKQLMGHHWGSVGIASDIADNRSEEQQSDYFGFYDGGGDDGFVMTEHVTFLPLQMDIYQHHGTVVSGTSWTHFLRFFGPYLFAFFEYKLHTLRLQRL